MSPLDDAARAGRDAVREQRAVAWAIREAERHRAAAGADAVAAFWRAASDEAHRLRCTDHEAPARRRSA